MIRTIRRSAFAVLMLGMLICLLCGCSAKKEIGTQSAAENGEETESRLITVGFSQLGSESVWRSANTVSMQESLTSGNGYFLIYENARQKQENQIKSIRSYISQRVDYIVFSPVTETGWDTVLKEAYDAGIPVITSDRQVDVEDKNLVSAWIGGDMFAEGEKAGIWLKENTDPEETLRIAVLTGTEGSSAQLGRSEGFSSIADTMDKWEILGEKCGDFTMARGKEMMEEFLKEHEEIDVLVSQNDDMTFGAIQAMEEKGIVPGKDMIIISFDAVKEALEMVLDGKINVDVECTPLLGPYVDELIKKMEKGGEYPKDNPVDEMVFTAENVKDYLDTRTY